MKKVHPAQRPAHSPRPRPCDRGQPLLREVRGVARYGEEQQAAADTAQISTEHGSPVKNNSSNNDTRDPSKCTVTRAWARYTSQSNRKNLLQELWKRSTRINGRNASETLLKREASTKNKTRNRK